MSGKLFRSSVLVLIVLLVTALACNLGTPRPPEHFPPTPAPFDAAAATAAAADELATEMAPPPSVAITHLTTPADVAATGELVYDVQSVGTAPEMRAPYGDSYDINRLERPFLQDMSYIPSLDLSTYMLGKDSEWFYVSIALVSGDPNDPLGIDYAVELDTDHDGFGNYVIWAHPPYPLVWDTVPVQIFRDTDHDTGGLSAEKSDAPLTGNGYDSLVFNGGSGDSDPDLAWVRLSGGAHGSVQFAFKRSWSGNIFMLGVLADAGLKDPQQLDYVDRLPLAEAGSPLRENQYYPLKALYAVDNICREAVGFVPNGYEPQLCPRAEPTKKPRPDNPEPPPPSVCPNTCGTGESQEPYPDCSCTVNLY